MNRIDTNKQFERIRAAEPGFGELYPAVGSAPAAESNVPPRVPGRGADKLFAPWQGAARLGRRALDWIVANEAALGTALGTVITLRVGLALVGLLASTFIPENAIDLVRHPSSNLLLDMWARWDGIRYLTIAAQGYLPHDDNLAFFPLYPALIKAVAFIFGGDLVLSGLAVATVAFFAALFYLYRLVELDLGTELAQRTVFYLSIAPMAFFFLAIYTEPLFLLFSVAAIYYARRSNWFAASLFGCFGVLTRPVGILLLVPLAYEMFRQWRARETRLSLAFLSLGAMPAALLGWMYYMHQLTGDWLAFVHAQAGNTWHRSTDVPWNTLLDAFRRLESTAQLSYNHGQYGVELAATFILLAAAVLAFSYLPRLYALYMAASVIFLLTSRSDVEVLFSMPRFAMVLFPLFMLLAMAGRHPQIHRFIVVISLLLLGLYTALFVQWYWIA